MMYFLIALTISLMVEIIRPRYDSVTTLKIIFSLVAFWTFLLALCCTFVYWRRR